MTSVLDRPLLYRLSCETTPEQVVGDYHNPLRVHDKNAILRFFTCVLFIRHFTGPLLCVLINYFNSNQKLAKTILKCDRATYFKNVSFPWRFVHRFIDRH